MAKSNTLRAVKNSYIPDWVDPEKYFALPIAARWNAAQSLLLILGDDSRAGAMAHLRGLPTEPPAFINLAIWLIPSNSRIDEARILEEHACADYALEMKAERVRAEAAKNCRHEYGEPIVGVDTQSCAKCGHVKRVFTLPC